MKVVILGGGPAGLYCGLLIKKAGLSHDVTIIERNPPDITYGWGVVFSDRTLASFQRADFKTYGQITDQFVIWDAIDVHYRGETIRCGGHVIASISRKRLLNILQERCAELGVNLRFSTEISDLSELPACDLLVGADGVNSLVRKTYEEQFGPSIELGNAKYIWLGADKVLDAFNFIFHQNEYGLFQVHAYPFSGSMSTFIVECDEQSWLNAGLDLADESYSLAFCQQLLKDDLGGQLQDGLLSNNSRWVNFPTLKTKHWSHAIQSPDGKATRTRTRLVLLGDSGHTAHFSIGAGTKLAMEDAISLAGALEQHPDLGRALNEYELERKPVVETFQRAAHESQSYFETIKRYLGLEPMPFAFQLLTRSGRISYDDLHFRDARFGDAVDRRFSDAANCLNRLKPKNLRVASESPMFAPPPMFAPITLRGLTLSNRIVASPRCECAAHDGAPGDCQAEAIVGAASGAGLVLTGICAVSPEGRITPGDTGMYDARHEAAWASVVEQAHDRRGHIAVQIGHAGRRGSTRPRAEGLDRPLREGNWPLLSASALPYTPCSQLPKEMGRADMDLVRENFVQAARMAGRAGFDMLQLHFADGYLLASFLSPLTNVRQDSYGGDLEGRLLCPIEVFDAVRAVWPSQKPLSVTLTASDCSKGGLEVEDAIAIARALKEHGCDLIDVRAGQTVPDGDPAYGRGYLTSYSERLRNGAGVPTMVGGYLSTSNEVNTVLAAGRGDLCIVSRVD